MKLTRVLTLALALVMLALCGVSCGEPKVTVNVTLQIIDEKDPSNPILETPVTVESVKPTVLEAVREALFVNEISYTLDESEMSIVDIDEYKDLDATKSGDGLVYYWMYFINDIEPASGKAGDNEIKEGDVIKYVYTSFNPEDVK